MNEKQRHLLQDLYQYGKKSADNFQRHFEEFVERDLEHFYASSGRSWVTPSPMVSNVFEYFILMATRVDLSQSVLTIEQMLHLCIVDVFYLPRLLFGSARHDGGMFGERAFSFLTMPSETEALGEWSDVLVADTERNLTPEYLKTQVIPVIDALSTIQAVYNEVVGENYHTRSVRVRAIKQQSPVSLSLQGTGDAINSVKEDIIPWRRRNAKQLAQLKAEELEAEIDKKRAEADQIRTVSTKDTAEADRIRAEAEKTRAEIEGRKLENQKLKFELESSKLQLALDIVSKMRPELTDHEKLTYAFKMLPAISTLATSELELKSALPRELPESTEPESSRDRPDGDKMGW